MGEEIKMEKYHNAIKTVLTDEASNYRKTRSGVDAISLFDYNEKYDLRKGFPLITTREINPNAVFTEMLWFLKGDTNIKYLNKNNVHIWDHWADENGDLGSIYGSQWRKWKNTNGSEIDQIANVIKGIKEQPYSKRHLVNAWNPSELEKMALPPCHTQFQFYVDPETSSLDCKLYQRAEDVALGMPFNVAGYALLTSIIAKETGLKPRFFNHSIGDMHIYCGKEERGDFYKENLEKIKQKVAEAKNSRDYLEIKDWILKNAPEEEFNWKKKRKEKYDHVPELLEQLSRKPFDLATLNINSNKKFDKIEPNEICLDNYFFHPRINLDVAI
jgi:thymidylate synthase